MPLKNLCIPLLICALSAACSSSTSSSGPATFPLQGKYLSDCIPLGGGGPSMKIYYEVQSNTLLNALVNYSSADCSGGYALTDFDGTPITEPMASRTNLELLAVTNVPAGMHTARFQVPDDSHEYNIFYLESLNSWYAPTISVTSNPGNAWSDWSAVPAWSAFVAAPTNPAHSYHFNRVTATP